MKALSTAQNLYLTINIALLRILSLALGGLLLYTATKKTMDLEAFSAHLELLPYVGKTAAYMLTALVVLVEYGLAVLILYRYRDLRVYSLLLVLMMVYTGYIYYILNHAPILPCSCQGAFKSITWQGHYMVNVVVTLLSATAIGLLYLRKKEKNETY